MASKKILVAPLDWGLGHATRCIPVVNLLLSKGVEVEIGASGYSYDLLKKEYPGLNFTELPGMDIRYTVDGNFIFQMLKQLPDFSSSIQAENKKLNSLIKTEGYDAVISDNRYGLHSPLVPCAFITHQLMLKTPAYLKFLERLLQKKLNSYIEKFNYCWIPDWKDDDSLSGDLCKKHKLSIPVSCIGPLSRFNDLNESTEIKTDFDLLALVSGPEPQKSFFESLIEQQAMEKSISTLIIQGKPGTGNPITSVNGVVKKINHADSFFIKGAVEKAKGIIARSGYSTIMDLVALCKHALLIPTPGQTEQEYLATHLKNKNYFRFATQDAFNIEDAFFDTDEYNFPQYSSSDLEKTVDDFLISLN